MDTNLSEQFHDLSVQCAFSSDPDKAFNLTPIKAWIDQNFVSKSTLLSLMEEIEKMKKECPNHGLHESQDGERLEFTECYGYDEYYNQSLDQALSLIKSKLNL